MELRKEVKRIRLPGQRNPVFQLIPQPEPSKSEMSPPSITTSDMLANVGLAESMAHVYRVRDKIREFGNSRLRATFA